MSLKSLLLLLGVKLWCHSGRYDDIKWELSSWEAGGGDNNGFMVVYSPWGISVSLSMAGALGEWTTGVAGVLQSCSLTCSFPSAVPSPSGLWERGSSYCPEPSGSSHHSKGNPTLRLTAVFQSFGARAGGVSESLAHYFQPCKWTDRKRI